MIKLKNSEIIVDVVFGGIVLLVGLTQIPHYFTGINPPLNSPVESVPASLGLGLLQIALVAFTLLLVVVAIKSQHRWLKNMGLIFLVLVLIAESFIAAGYSGL